MEDRQRDDKPSEVKVLEARFVAVGPRRSCLAACTEEKKEEESDRGDLINIGIVRRAKRSYSERAKDRGWLSADSEHPWPREKRER